MSSVMSTSLGWEKPRRITPGETDFWSFRGATGEDDIPRRRTHQCRHLGAGDFDPALEFGPEPMAAGGVAPFIVKPRQHRPAQSRHPDPIRNVRGSCGAEIRWKSRPVRAVRKMRNHPQTGLRGGMIEVVRADPCFGKDRRELVRRLCSVRVLAPGWTAGSARA